MSTLEAVLFACCFFGVLFVVLNTTNNPNTGSFKFGFLKFFYFEFKAKDERSKPEKSEDNKKPRV